MGKIAGYQKDIMGDHSNNNIGKPMKEGVMGQQNYNSYNSSSKYYLQ